MRYRNVSGHAEVLADGRTVGYLGEESFVDLSGKDLEVPETRALVEQGNFIEAPETKPPTLKELRAQAAELGIEGASSMNQDEVTKAIADKRAELAAAESGQSEQNGEGDG